MKQDKNILKCSWFDYKMKKDLKTLVIGNPPFGKNNKLSKEFIKHTAQFDNVYTIAFILQNVYNKHTLQKSIPKEYRLKKVYKLPEKSFIVNNEDYHVPCSFYIFENSKGECLRFNPEKSKETEDWEFVKKEEGDFFVLGASQRKVKEKSEVNKNNRGYYIKVKDKTRINEIKQNFKNFIGNGNSSVNGGISWITKQELVKIYQDNLNF